MTTPRTRKNGSRQNVRPFVRARKQFLENHSADFLPIWQTSHFGEWVRYRNADFPGKIALGRFWPKSEIEIFQRGDLNFVLTWLENDTESNT